MRKKYGSSVETILTLLRENGPMTRSQLEEDMEVGKAAISAILSRMRRESIECPKRIYIAKWVNNRDTGRAYPRAMYALGDLPCKKKPKPEKHRETVARHVQKRNTLARSNFVFNLGLTEKQLGFRG